MSDSFLRHSGVAHVNEGSHSFTCHPHVYPQLEWAILPLLPSCAASPHFGWYSFPVLLRAGGWDGPSCLILRWFASLMTVTHPTTNCGGGESNSWPSSRKPNALTKKLPSYLSMIFRFLMRHWLQITTHHNRFMALFPGPSGWAGAKRELGLYGTREDQRLRYVVHGRGCNPHRSLWRHWWRHNSETIRDREKRRPPLPMKSSELSNGENRIALRQLLQNRKLRHLWRHNLGSRRKLQTRKPRKGLRSSPPACTASLVVGSSKTPWPWLWPWIGSRSHQHTQYM